MNVLVAHGSRMGGTAGIAHAIADRFETDGFDVKVVAADEVEDPLRFDAVLVGSALYAGRWRGESVKLVKRLARKGYKGPVWLFHSGPLGDEEAASEQPFPKKVLEYAHDLDVRGWKTFGGVLDEHPSGFIAKAMAREMAGDWRDWNDIGEWADSIVRALEPHRAA